GPFGGVFSVGLEARETPGRSLWGSVFSGAGSQRNSGPVPLGECFQWGWKPEKLRAGPIGGVFSVGLEARETPGRSLWESVLIGAVREGISWSVPLGECFQLGWKPEYFRAGPFGGVFSVGLEARVFPGRSLWGSVFSGAGSQRNSGPVPLGECFQWGWKPEKL